MPILYKFIMMLLCCDSFVFAKPPIVEYPYDVAAGGASLTRASQDGILFSNPALLPYGGKFLRWLGQRTAIHVGKDSVDMAKGLASSSADANALIDAVFTTPVHVEADEVVSLITNNGGIALFSANAIDLRAWKRGDPEESAGSPSIVFQSENYAGAIASLAARSPFSWFSMGVNAKYFLGNASAIHVDLIDQDSYERVQTKLSDTFSQKALSPKMGGDVGTLFFFQGSALDLRIAGMYEDMAVSGASPTVNAGVGVTLHTDQDSIHMAVDYRDMQNAYEEEMFKRIYMGTKLTLQGLIAFGTGLYNGYPSVGMDLNLWILKLGALSYTRELGKHPGVDPRKIYSFNLSTGFSF